MKPQITEHQARILMNQAYRLLMTVYGVIEVGELYNHPRYPNLYTKLSERHTRRYELLQSLSAVLASTSPEPVVVNAVVEIAQGTTYCLCQDCNEVSNPCSGKDYCICDFGTNDEPFFPRVIYPSDSYKSVLDLIPLSAYQDHELDRVGG